MLKIESSTTPQSAQLIRDFLVTKHSGVLATADKAATPHAAAVYFSVDEELCLVFATKIETQKYKNIEQNDQVAVVSYDEVSQTSLQLMGRAVIFDDPSMRDEAVNKMHQFSASISKTELPPAEKIYGGEYAVVKIIPAVIKMAIYARPDSQGDDIYETLIFSESD